MSPSSNRSAMSAPQTPAPVVVAAASAALAAAAAAVLVYATTASSSSSRSSNSAPASNSAVVVARDPLARTIFASSKSRSSFSGRSLPLFNAWLVFLARWSRYNRPTAWGKLVDVTKNLLCALRTYRSYAKIGYWIPSSSADLALALVFRPTYGYLYAPVVTSAPHSVTTVEAHGGKLWDVVNLASTNYLGFERLDSDFLRWVDTAVRALPSSGFSDTTLLPVGGGGGVDARTPMEAIVQALQAELASFVEKEDCLVFSSGYMANYSTLSHLFNSKTVLVFDEYSHNSMWWGFRNGKPIEMMSFKHNNMKDLAAKLEKVYATYTDPDVVVAVEGVYSMEGTLVDLPAIAKLKEKYGFTLFVDEAHSMFALGPRGRGVADHFGIDLSVIDVHIATLSKTLAAVGGFVAASKSVLDRVRSKSLYFAFDDRAFPITLAARVLYALRHEGHRIPRRVRRLRAVANRMRDAFRAAGFVAQGVPESPIIPLVVFYLSKGAELGNLLRERGVGIVLAPPSHKDLFSVKIRVSVSSGLSDEQVDHVINVIIDTAAELAIIPPRAALPAAARRLIENPPALPSEHDDADEKLCSTAESPLELFPELVPFLRPSGPSAVAAPAFIAKHDVHGIASLPSAHTVVAAAARKYGLGSCSAAAYYGTFDVHRSLENAIRDAIGTERVLLSSCGLNVVTSVATAMCLDQGADTRHIVLCDRLARTAIIEGVRGKSRSVEVYYFDHCDAQSFRERLETDVFGAAAGKRKAAKKDPRKIFVTVLIEGISQRTGRVFPLPDFVAVIDALRARYPRRMNHRFFVDESNSFGVLTAPRAVGCPSSSSPAQTGLFAYHGIRFDPRTSQHVFAGSLSRAVAAQGGFAAGNEVTATTFILKHRSYLYSCSQPPAAAALALHNLAHILDNADALRPALRERVKAARAALAGFAVPVDAKAERDSPAVLVRAPARCLEAAAEKWGRRMQIEFVADARDAIKLTVLPTGEGGVYAEFARDLEALAQEV